MPYLNEGGGRKAFEVFCVEVDETAAAAEDNAADRISFHPSLIRQDIGCKE